ncbi:SDR family NAD(P)-dependent oxidoreductase [Sphingobium sp. TCM1]|uniref:SDR family NAD(P)-dependent oxidoreductase n=1 Tax=Sphingobium sp. TCM1 TaxID=453246 RepID=UPI0007F3B446|nr:glucose 1-dehydrogenase [Sphingobium sp. TCM1]OAN56231.1 hypothetical protein A7Q26_02135 [Sphingobium sp. TCM1]
MAASIDIQALFGLTGKSVLVTGAAEGMGREIALYLGSAGAKVALADINGEGAAKAAAELTALGVEAIAITMDQGKETDVRAAVEQASSAFSGLDLLVNNAAIQDKAYFSETDATLLDRLYAVNLRGPLLLAQEAARIMTSQGRGGAIVNIGSLGGVHPMMRGLTGYNAMKAAVHSWTRQAALELGEQGIRVNAILPGPVPTEGSLRSPGPLETEKLMTKMPLPVGRLGLPGDIAAATVYLLSDASAFVTGHLLIADGGFLLL